VVGGLHEMSTSRLPTLGQSGRLPTLSDTTTIPVAETRVTPEDDPFTYLVFVPLPAPADR
jgi:hypothetical protein